MRREKRSTRKVPFTPEETQPLLPQPNATAIQIDETPIDSIPAIAQHDTPREDNTGIQEVLNECNLSFFDEYSGLPLVDAIEDKLQLLGEYGAVANRATLLLYAKEEKQSLETKIAKLNKQIPSPELQNQNGQTPPPELLNRLAALNDRLEKINAFITNISTHNRVELPWDLLVNRLKRSGFTELELLRFLQEKWPAFDDFNIFHNPLQLEKPIHPISAVETYFNKSYSLKVYATKVAYLYKIFGSTKTLPLFLSHQFSNWMLNQFSKAPKITFYVFFLTWAAATCGLSYAFRLLTHQFFILRKMPALQEFNRIIEFFTANGHYFDYECYLSSAAEYFFETAPVLRDHQYCLKRGRLDSSKWLEFNSTCLYTWDNNIPAINVDMSPPKGSDLNDFAMSNKPFFLLFTMYIWLLVPLLYRSFNTLTAVQRVDQSLIITLSYIPSLVMTFLIILIPTFLDPYSEENNKLCETAFSLVTDTFFDSATGQSHTTILCGEPLPHLIELPDTHPQLLYLYLTLLTLTSPTAAILTYFLCSFLRIINAFHFTDITTMLSTLPLPEAVQEYRTGMKAAIEARITLLQAPTDSHPTDHQDYEIIADEADRDGPVATANI